MEAVPAQAVARPKAEPVKVGVAEAAPAWARATPFPGFLPIAPQWAVRKGIAREDGGPPRHCHA